MTKIFTFLLICLLPCFSPVSAQKIKEIDSLIAEAGIENWNGTNPKGTLKKAFEIIELSEAIQYDKGIVKGNALVATVLNRNGEYKKSLQYVNRGLSYKSYLASEPVNHFYLLMDQAENYYTLEFTSLAKESYQNAELVISNEKNEIERDQALFFLYTNGELITNDPDTLYQYYIKARKIIEKPSFNAKNVGNNSESKFQVEQSRALVYVAIGRTFLQKKNADSAHFYFNEALTIFRGVARSHYYEVYIYNGLSDLEEQLKNYPSAIAYRQKSITAAEKHLMKEFVLEGYESIARLYKLSNNTETAKTYERLHEDLAKSLDKERKEARDVAIISLVEEHEAELKQTHSRNQMIMVGIAITAIIVLVSLYIIFNRYKNYKRTDALMREQALIKESHQKISQIEEEAQLLTEAISKSSEELRIKAEEIQLLQQKINESFDELLIFAKENHPNFYVRFQEVYPNLHLKLLNIAPELHYTELTLCAYIYLDFSTKDIAEYAFKSHRTIQNRKNSLRKRLQIESSDDLYVWFKNL